MEIRELQTKDMFKGIKILKKINMMDKIKGFATEIANMKEEDRAKKQNEMGADLMFSIIENIDLAENEIYELLGSLVGKKATVIANQSPKETFALIKEVADSGIFNGFFTELPN